MIRLRPYYLYAVLRQLDAGDEPVDENSLLAITKRLIACGMPGEIKVLLNPEVVEKRGTYSGYESCLSLPDTERKIINRPDFIKVKYKSLDNKESELTATNEYAALLTHEIDHLNGILFSDYEHAGLDT